MKFTLEETKRMKEAFNAKWDIEGFGRECIEDMLDANTEQPRIGGDRDTDGQPFDGSNENPDMKAPVEQPEVPNQFTTTQGDGPLPGQPHDCGHIEQPKAECQRLEELYEASQRVLGNAMERIRVLEEQLEAAQKKLDELRKSLRETY